MAVPSREVGAWYCAPVLTIGEVFLPGGVWAFGGQAEKYVFWHFSEQNLALRKGQNLILQNGQNLALGVQNLTLQPGQNLALGVQNRALQR